VPYAETGSSGNRRATCRGRVVRSHPSMTTFDARWQDSAGIGSVVGAAH